MWKSTSELGYRRRKHWDDVASMAWDDRRVDGVGRQEFDFHTGWKEGGVYRESQKEGPMRAALERLWALRRGRADEYFEAHVAADIAAGGDGKGWGRQRPIEGSLRSLDCAACAPVTSGALGIGSHPSVSLGNFAVRPGRN